MTKNIYYLNIKQFGENVDVDYIQKGFEDLSIRTEGEARLKEVLAVCF